MPINSEYVELWKFTFRLVELLITAPFLMVIIDPAWIFVSACTANDTLMYHVKVFLLSTSNAST